MADPDRRTLRNPDALDDMVAVLHVERNHLRNELSGMGLVIVIDPLCTNGSRVTFTCGTKLWEAPSDETFRFLISAIVQKRTGIP